MSRKPTKIASSLSRLPANLATAVCSVALVVGSVNLGARVAHADPAAAPSAEDMAAAKAAFGEGKALFEAKKYSEAVGKFKQSYRLSKNPLLLYNIGLTLENNNQKDTALFYYQKFLTDAPKDAAQRADVVTRVAAINKELDLGESPAATEAPPAPTKPSEEATTEPVKAKPAAEGEETTEEAAGTEEAPAEETPPPKAKKPPKASKIVAHDASDFQHVVVDEAPPGKPLDITAYAPPDAGWQVTLYYRVAGEDHFTAKLMRPRYSELLARIPASKMTGKSVQYYVEVKDHTGEVVTRVAKPSSPNVIYLETTAPARFYPDWSDDAGAIQSGDDEPAGKPAKAAAEHKREVDDDPLHGKAQSDADDDDSPTTKQHAVVEEPDAGTVGPQAPEDTGVEGNGYFDVGSKKFTRAKWVATGATGAFAAATILFFIRESNASNTVEQEAALSKSGTCTGGPPCRQFDSYLSAAEATGKSAAMWGNITMGVGIVSAAVAGYYWYKALTHKAAPAGDESSTQTASAGSWITVPVVSENTIGAAAMVSF